MKSITLALLLVLVVAVAAVVFQNQAPWQARFLWLTGEVPGIIVLFLTAAGIPWLFIVSSNERYLHGIAAALQQQSASAEILFMPGKKHGSDILLDRPDIAERIAVRFQSNLKP